QALFPVEGTLRGEADFWPGEGKFPQARFAVTGTNVGNETLTAKALNLAGRFEWPHLILTNSSVELADGSVATISGGLDVQNLDVSNGLFLVRGPFLRQWLPSAYSYENLTVSGTLHGPVRKLRHEGAVEVSGFSSPDLQPLVVRGNWQGTV